MNDYYQWLDELATAANHVIDSWESGDLATAVNELREVLEEGGFREKKTHHA